MLPIIRTSVSYAGVAARRIRHRHSLPDLPSQFPSSLESEITTEMIESTKSADRQIEDQLQEAFASGSVQKAISSQQSNLKLNPSVLWIILVKGKSHQPEAEVLDEGLHTSIEKANISLEMQEALSEAGFALQESGWGWLTYDPRSNILKLSTYASQNPTDEEAADLIPLLESLINYQKFVLTKFF